MIVGIFFIFAACLCWGFIFIVPQFLTAFDPIKIALGRFFVFGLLSLLCLLVKKRHFFHRSYLPLWRQAVQLGFLATVVPYTGLVCCLRYANPAVTALIYGLAPITISLLGNWKKKQSDLRSFLVPGLFTALGLTLTNLNAFYFTGSSLSEYLFGLLCGFAGLFSWTWYAVFNSEFLDRNQNITMLDWVTLMGTTTLFVVIGIAACLQAFVWHQVALQAELFGPFLLGSAILGIVSTYAAFLFWNAGTKRLPISLVGQLSVFEMIFGLFFIFLVEERLPNILETGGILLIITAVFLALKSLKRVSAV